MNPSSQPPIDYLNQIAPSAPKKQIFQLNMRTILIGLVALIALFVAISMITGLISSNQKKPWMQLSAKLATTQEIVTDSSTKIKNGQLKSTNSDLKLYLANTIRGAEEPLSSLDINPEKLPKDITDAEGGEAMIARLEDARLNAKFDSTYAREMTYQLTNLLTLLQQLQQSSGKTETKAFLQTAYDSLVPLQEKVADFSASNE